MSESSWVLLLERVRQDTPTFLSDFMSALRGADGYDHGAVPEDDLERTAMQVFDLFIARLGARVSPEADALPEALGRRRARQGIRIDQFMVGVRINFRLLWQALYRAAEPDLFEVLIEHGDRVLEVVERFATEVQAAFLDETQVMAQFHRTARERAIARIFAGSTDGEELRNAAEVLALEADFSFEMISIRLSTLTDEARHALSGNGVFSYQDGELHHSFAQTRESPRWGVTSSGLAGVHFRRIRGLVNLHRAAALSRQILQTAELPGVVTLREAFGLLAHAQLHEQLKGFEHELLGKWHDASSSEQRRMTDALSAFAHSGSIQAAADELFLHRNTVFKRLRSFTEITGLDVTVPRDAAIALVLLSPIPRMSE